MKLDFTIKEGINHVLIPVYVNGKGPYNFTLDTGAQKTTISSVLIEEVGLETEELLEEKYRVLKEKRSLKLSKANLKIGNEELNEEEVWVMNLAFDKGPSCNDEKHLTLGVIGYSTLKNYCISINYRTQILQLERSSKELKNINQEKMNKFEYIEDTHIIGVPVLINDEGPFLFVLDTGAGGTTITKNLAEKLRLPLNDQAVRAVGIYGSQDAQLTTIKKISVSSKTFENVFTVIIDESLAGPRGKLIQNGILGYTIFKNKELIIDYPNKTYALI